MLFQIASGLSFLASTGLAIAYMEVKKKISSLTGAKKDFARIFLYIGFLGIILIQVYLLQQICPQTQTWLRYLVALPFIGGYGFLGIKLKALKKIDES